MKNPLKNIVELFPGLALFYRNSRDLLDQRQKPRNTPWGFSLAGNDAMAEGSFEPEETKLVRSLLSNVDILVNIGANVGYYCCHALSMGKQVIAVEPNTRNIHYLLKNINENGWSKSAEVFPVALGAGTDILNMWGGGTGASLIKGWANIPDSYLTQVPILSLDRLLGETLGGKKALILVDIEGAELMMLQGAKQTLKNEPKPIWLIEITTSQNQPEGTSINPNFSNIFDLFFNLGYLAFTADEAAIKITPKIVGEATRGKQIPGNHNYVFKQCQEQSQSKHTFQKLD